jgi:sulfite reductase (ferredoxin)
VSRVFARLGEKQSRARARIKFLVQKVGIDEFKRLVAEEREGLRHDERWTAFLEDLHSTDETPVREAGPLPAAAPPDFRKWAEHNLKPQAQDGYYTAVIKLPLGDFTSTQGRALADLAREYTGDSIRCTVEQNLAFRWLSGADAVAFFERLVALNMAEAGAGTITDMTSCPGTDTCKLGISASRGVTGELRKRLAVIEDQLDPAVRALRMKASGCFNSCGQHHAADIGFTGVSRQVGGRKVPHFNVVLGGQWTENAKSYGLVVGAVPSKNIPKAVELITQHYLANREGEESFQAFIARVGKKEFRKVLAPIQKPPSYEQDPSYYSDWGDPREYGIGDIGVGECAGEIVPFVEFGLQEAEQLLHDAQDALEAGQADAAAQGGFTAMVTAAKALVRHLEVQVKDEADDVISNFRTHLHDTEVFHDPFAKGKFASYLLKMHEDKSYENADDETAHRALDEAQLFIEAAHGCYQRLTQAAASAAAAE